MKKTNATHSGKEGAILGIVLVMMVMITTVILSLFQQAAHGVRETDYELKGAQAFWLAEAGREWSVQQLYDGKSGESSGETVISGSSPGTFLVEKDGADALISTGTVVVGDRTVTRRIRFGIAYVVQPFEKAIYAGNAADADWTFQLRGTGQSTPNAYGSGGIDSILGDLGINGNVLMQEHSKVAVPSPNNYNLKGNVDATGTITQSDTATISGAANSLVFSDPPPDLSVMDYAHTSDYDVAAEFNKLGITSGYLPDGHPLHDLVVKNPSDRRTENASTKDALGNDIDDFYFEPSRITGSGSATTGSTPLNLGDDKTYYVDGHVWFHSKRTFGFKVDGQAAIISTQDIHVSDNLNYADRSINGDLLALVALGKYSGEVLGSGGNVYFGDPEFGTLYTADAFMFANNNFYYNTDSTNDEQMRPSSGFKVFGNFMAVNQVKVLRDWYRSGGKYRAAEYDPNAPEGERWKDAITGAVLTAEQYNHLTHYAIQIQYDDRIRNAATQMSGLPRGRGTIFAGETSWEEISAD